MSAAPIPDRPHELPEETLDLLSRFQRGDAAAGEELFSRYYPRVRRILRVRLASRGRWNGELEDLLQETFLAAVRGLEGFEPRAGGGFVHWLTTIAERKLEDAFRRERAQKRDRGRELPIAALGAPDASASSAWDPADDTTRVPDKVARGEELSAVDRCLAGLRADYREVILLRMVAGSPWRFVAAELGLPSADAAQHHFGRAKAALAAAMLRAGHAG